MSHSIVTVSVSGEITFVWDVKYNLKFSMALVDGYNRLKKKDEDYYAVASLL